MGVKTSSVVHLGARDRPSFKLNSQWEFQTLGDVQGGEQPHDFC